MEAIFGRRSVRDYLPDPVPQEAIIRLIEAAIQAPSAINQQPWRFVVIRDRSLLEQISRDAKKHMLSAASTWRLPAHLSEKLADPAFNLFYHAPALIVIAAPSVGPWIVEDCALAAENLMLAAHGDGFGACWIGLAQSWLATPKGKDMIGLPQTHVPVAPIIVGIPKTPAPTVPRKPPEIHWVG
jgi:nitroreductase